MASLCQSTGSNNHHLSVIENVEDRNSTKKKKTAAAPSNNQDGTYLILNGLEPPNQSLMMGSSSSSSSSSSTSSSPTSNANLTSSITSTFGPILKEDVFECISRSHETVRLILTSSHLLLQLTTTPYSIDILPLNDLFGCHTFRHKNSSTHFGAYICFYFYIKRKKGLFISSNKILPISSPSTIAGATSPSNELKYNFSHCKLEDKNIHQNNKTNSSNNHHNGRHNTTNVNNLNNLTNTNSNGNKYHREKTPIVFHIKKPDNNFNQNLHIATDWKDTTLGILRTKFSQWQLDKFKKTIEARNTHKIQASAAPHNHNHHHQDENSTEDTEDSDSSDDTNTADKPQQQHGFPFTPTKLPSYDSGKRMSLSNNDSSNGNNSHNHNNNNNNVNYDDDGSTSINNSKDNKDKKNHSSNNAELNELSIAITTYRLLQRKFLIILNPKSGQGKTMTLFQEKVHPILIEGGIKVMLLITERPGHARSMVSSADLSDIDGIATVGGDGLLYEVVNGLRSRADSQKYADIPLGVIAGGSGNGLARSIASYSGEDQDYLHNPVVESTLAIARGKVIPVNLAEVELDGRKIYSFLSVGWGLLADIDIESEVLRGIGEIRFFLWAFLRLAKLRTYNAQLSYIPYNTCNNKINNHQEADNINVDSTNHLKINKDEDDDDERINIDGNFISVYSSVQSHIGSDMTFAPSAKSNDGLIHLTIVRGGVGRTRATQFLLGLDKGEHLDVTGVEYVPVKEFSLKSDGGIAGTVTIDGERVMGEYLNVKISPKPLNVFSL